MSHVYLTLESIQKALQSKAITQKEAKELKRLVTPVKQPPAAPAGQPPQPLTFA